MLMKTAKNLTAIFSLFALFFCALGTLAAEQALDVLNLKGGRVVQGHILNESDTKVDVSMAGTTRTFDRNFITKINYSSLSESPSAPPPRPASDVHAGAGNALIAELADQYRVPESSVLWVRRQGISDADLPEVLQVAAEAQVPMGEVARARLQGRSWDQIRGYYGLDGPRRSSHVVVVAPVDVVAPLLIFRILFFPFF